MALPTLYEVVSAAAAEHPTKTFLTSPSTDTSVTYGALAESTEALRGLLQAHTQPGDRVCAVVENHWIFFPLIAACVAEGRVLVPLNPTMHPDELKFVGRDSEPALVIRQDDVEIPPKTLSATQLSVSDALASSTPPGEAQGSQVIGDETPAEGPPCLFVYTSGTTGSGKAVMLSSSNLVSMARTFIDHYQVTSEDRFLGVLPLYHMNGIMVTGLLPLVAGAQTVISDVFSFMNAKYYWEIAAREEITIPSLVPSIMAMLLRIFPKGPGVDLESIRLAFCGTAPLPEPLWRAFEERFGVPVYQGYGLTETTTWVTATPYAENHAYDTVGVPFGAAIHIDPRSATGPHGAGEILVRGGSVMSGYFNRNKLTRESFRDGFLKTGDLGYIDDAGELHVTGRKKEIIIRNGVNINPQDVDEVVGEHPGVVESKTIGVAHDVMGESVVTVCVRGDEELDGPAVRDWVKERMSDSYVPDRVLFLRTLPKGPTGKVMIRDVRGIISGERAKETLAKLTARRYRRTQTADGDAITERVQSAYLEGRPVQFLTYWGCGKRRDVAEVDTAALDRLQSFLADASLVQGSPMHLVLMLNSMHSTVNEFPEDHYRAYYSAIQVEAERRGFEVVWQDDVWNELGLDVQQVIDRATSRDFDDEWEAFEIREQLVRQAEKHFQGGGAEAGARRYALTCLVEGPAFAKHYPDSIFLTYNGPDMDACLPDLPKLYLYSFKKGVTVKPWFT
ncbi:MAG: class I adenylate-forming enzyme family protein [Gemmatimonadota bacterium]